jgi:ribonuclease Z
VRTVFHPFLPNGPTGDPVLWVDLPDEGHSVMVDLGDLAEIPTRKLLRVSRVVVTHAHMDHFIGFDRLLRVLLGRGAELTITGPTGFLARVEGRVSGYTWNLIESYPVRLVVEEVDGDRVHSVAYSGESGMRPDGRAERAFTGTIHEHRAYTVAVDVLDHGVPVLGVLLRETEHLSVNRDRLARAGLKPGAWLAELKNAVRRCRPRTDPIDAERIDGTRARTTIGEAADEILFRTPGQRIAYLTDFGATPANLERAAALARDADLLVCETPFLHADLDLARERRHLTARQAGELARAAGAKRLAPFHFSPRYPGRERELVDEAAAAFGGPVVELPRGPRLGES